MAWPAHPRSIAPRGVPLLLSFTSAACRYSAAWDRASDDLPADRRAAVSPDRCRAADPGSGGWARQVAGQAASVVDWTYGATTRDASMFPRMSVRKAVHAA